MDNLPANVLARIGAQLRARNMASLARTSTNMRGQFIPQVRERRANTNARRNTFAKVARALGKFKKTRPRYHPAQSAVYKAITNLERNRGMNLSELKKRVYSTNQGRNFGFVTRVGPWWINTGNHNQRDIPRTITLIHNTTGHLYSLRYNPNTRRYNLPH